MIICHPRKLIFIKTKKVGGSSFEIALSRFCSSACVITPFKSADENIRTMLGHRGPQNYDRPYWPDVDFRSGIRFYGHTPAPLIRENIPERIWSSYRKISIHRNPYEHVISHYFFDAHPRGLDFGTYVRDFRHLLGDNIEIAPPSGPNGIDNFLRYEHLEEDMTAIGLSDVHEVFRRIRAKGRFRPKEGADAATMYGAYPEAAAIVAEVCAEEIAHFGYTLPGPSA